MDKAGRIKELIGILNEAGRAYYAGDKAFPYFFKEVDKFGTSAF